MKKRVFLLGLFVVIISSMVMVAQNVGINATGTPPNVSAGLDVDFTTKGLLIPRISLTSATDAVTIPSPATSLLVYNNGSGGLAPAGYYYNAGTPVSPNWIKLLVTGSPSDAWLMLGNAGTTPGTHFLGTIDNVDLVFKTNNIERMRILSTGRVGINTSTPGSYYLDVLSNNSAIDGLRGQHTSGSAVSAFAAVTGNVSNAAYTSATGYLAYHNSNNITLGVYGNGGDLAGMFNGKVGINSVSTNLTNYDLEVRNNVAANPANVLLRATAQKTNINDVLTNLDFGDSYNTAAQAKIQVIRNAAASSVTDLPTALTFWTTSDGTSTISERMRINSNGDVGIGTTNPLEKLNIIGSIVIQNYIDNMVLSLQTPQSKQFDLIGSYMGWDQNAIYIGGYNVNLPTTRFGLPSSANKVVCGGNLPPYTGIDIYALNFFATSSKKVKENIRTISYGLKEVLLINPITYTYIFDKNKIPQIGLIAEELVNITPEIVSVLDDNGNSVDPKKQMGNPAAIDYGKLAPVLVNAIKELHQMIEQQQKQIEELKAKIEEQKTKQ